MLSAGAAMAGLGHAAPEAVVDNADIEADLGLPPGWIERRTGIRRRRWAGPDETLADLAAAAARSALAMAGLPGDAPGDAVGLLLLATSTPDQALPPSAPRVAHMLGLRCGAVDLTGACAGFVYALTLAEAQVRRHGRAAVVVAANLLSRRIDRRDAATAALFADAAGAVVLVPSGDPRQGVLGCDLASDGAGYGLLGIPPGTDAIRIADGPAVFAAAVDMMAAAAARALAAAGLDGGAVDRLVPHQANDRIVGQVARRLGIGPARVVRTLAEYGNASAATIPFALSTAHEAAPFRAGETLLLTAAGAGMTGGALVWGL